MTKFVATMDGKAIGVMIRDIEKRSKLLLPDVHVASCSIIAHAVKHGDATMATRMPDAITTALGGAWRLNAMRQWFEAMGPFRWDGSKEGGREPGFRIHKEKRAEMAAELEKIGEAKFLQKLIDLKTFSDFKPESPYQAFDFRAQLAALIKKANNKQKDKTRMEDSFIGLEQAAELLVQLTEVAVDKATKAKKAKVAKAA